jgi:hypothetical protein
MLTLIERLEARLSRWAIPNVLTFVAGLQVLVLLLFMMIPEQARLSYLDVLVLDARLWQGQVWRAVSFLCIPGSMNVLVVMIGCMFLSWCGRGLEAMWGAFRTNLYLLLGVILLAVGALSLNFVCTGSFLFAGVTLAFATLYPDEQIMMFGLIPMKMRWVGWLTAGFLGMMVFDSSSPSELGMILCSVGNYFLVFGWSRLRGASLRVRMQNRRSEFERSAGSAESFHLCSVCGKTEKDDAALEFRILADGQEICSACRKVK